VRQEAAGTSADPEAQPDAILILAGGPAHADMQIIVPYYDSMMVKIGFS